MGWNYASKLYQAFLLNTNIQKSPKICSRTMHKHANWLAGWHEKIVLMQELPAEAANDVLIAGLSPPVDAQGRIIAILKTPSYPPRKSQSGMNYFAMTTSQLCSQPESETGQAWHRLGPFLSLSSFLLSLQCFLPTEGSIHEVMLL